MGRKYPEDSQSVYCPSSITHSPPGTANRKKEEEEEEEEEEVEEEKKEEEVEEGQHTKKNTSQIYSEQILRKDGGQVGV